MTASADLTDLAKDGADITLRVTPRAARAGITRDANGISIRVTEAPQDGKANEAVQRALARALGIAKSRLTLTRGHSARIKTFRIDL